MKSFRVLMGLSLLIAASVAAGHALGARSAQPASGAAGTMPQSSAATFPKDVYPDSGNRLPVIKREDLDDAGKKVFDLRGSPDGYGPGGIRLYSMPLADHMGAVNDFLRRKAGVDPKIAQLAILITVREFDSEYVWTSHEPQAQKAGLPQEIIDAVKYRKSTEGLPEKDAVIIDLGREVIEKHHVSSATYARAQGLYGQQGLVNIVALMGDYASTAILLNTFDQHIRPTDKPLLPMP